MFPGPVDQINWEDFHTQSPLNAIHHNVKAFAVPDDEAGMIQFVRHLFEVQVGILRHRQLSDSVPLGSETWLQLLLLLLLLHHCHIFKRRAH